MANQFQSINSGLAELKNFYQGPIVDQFSEDCAIYRGAEKSKFSWSGLQVIRPLKVRRNPGIGATSDGGPLPSIGRQTTIQGIIPAKFNYLRFGVTGPMIKASRNDVGAFVRAAAYELQEGYNDLRSDVNRQLSWNGNGTLARVNATAVGSTSIVIKGREDTEPALKFLDEDYVVDIYNGSTPVATGITITDITAGDANSATATISLSGAVTVSADMVLIRSGSFGFEVQGVLTQLDGLTTTVFNIDRSQYIQTQGNVINLSSGQMTLDAWQRMQDEAERRGGRGVNCFWTDFPSRRMYQKLLVADKRYVNTVKGDGGFSDKEKSYLEFNGIPIVADKDCPTRVFALPDKYIEKQVLCEMEFADETGTMYIAQTSADELEVRVRLFMNLFNAKAAGSAVMTQYTSP